MTTDADTLQKIYDAIRELRSEMNATYVTKDAFDPVKRIVYGLVALILVAVIGAMLGMVVIDSARTNATTISEPINK